MSAESYKFHSNRWKSEISQIDYWQKPLDPEYWPRYVREGQIFSRLADKAIELGYKPFFAINPSNPMMINDTNRTAAFERNAQILKMWSEGNGYGFLNAGLLDKFDEVLDFEDHRHISAAGAQKYTNIIAEQFFNSVNSSACSSSD